LPQGLPGVQPVCLYV